MLKLPTREELQHRLAHWSVLEDSAADRWGPDDSITAFYRTHRETCERALQLIYGVPIRTR